MNTPAGSGRTINTVHGVGTQVAVSRILRVTSIATTSVQANSATAGVTQADCGTLNYCINRHNTLGGPSTIVFEVSGTIGLATPLYTVTTPTASRLTIAFETAPSPGIQIRGRFPVGGVDKFISHACVRYGYNFSQLDCMEIVGNPAGPARLVFDHCLAAWGGDETFSMGVGASPSQVTISNSVIAEGAGSEGTNAHMYNALIAGDEVLHYGTLIHSSVARNPRLKGVRFGTICCTTYNWRQAAIDWGSNAAQQHVTMAGGTWINGPGNVAGEKPLHHNSEAVSTPGSTLYFNDNRWIQSPTVTQTTRAQLVTVSGAVSDPGATPTWWPVGLIADTSINAHNILRDFVGPRPAERDAHTTALINHIINRTHDPKTILNPATLTGGNPLMADTRQLTNADFPVFAQNTRAFPATPPGGGNWNDIVLDTDGVPRTRLEVYVHTLEDQVL
jgi:hypothetical protein